MKRHNSMKHSVNDELEEEPYVRFVNERKKVAGDPNYLPSSTPRSWYWNALNLLRDAYSIPKNWNKLTVRPNNTFASVDGVRAMSVIWLIAFHSLWMIRDFCNKKKQCKGTVINDLYEKMSLRLVFAGQLGVDVFFVLSGFLIAHFLMSEYLTYGKVSYWKYYVRRAMRIVPAYYTALVVLLIVDLNFLPLPNTNHAWTAFTFAFTFWPQSTWYMVWAWSLCVEVQFYVTFPLFFTTLMKMHTKVRLPFLIFWYFGSYVVRAIFLYNTGLSIPEFGPENPEFTNEWYSIFWVQVYTPIWMRYGSIYVGVILAYIYHFHFRVLTNLHKKEWAIGLLFITSVCCFVFAMAPYPFHIGLWKKGFAFLWITSARIVMSTGIAILLFCTFGDSKVGRVVGWFLKWDCWHVIAQLSYGGYLIHPMMIGLFYGTKLLPIQLIPAVIYCYALFFVFVTFIMALLMYFLVEAPFMNMRIGKLKSKMQEPKVSTKKEEPC